MVLQWILHVRQSTRFLGGILSSFSWCTCDRTSMFATLATSPDALHHGRYGPEGQYYSSGLSMAGIAGFALCFPSLSTGVRCLASWSVWTRRALCSYTVAALFVDSGSACARLVLLGFCSSCCVPLGRRQACDVRHHGRDEPEGQYFWISCYDEICADNYNFSGSS